MSAPLPYNITVDFSEEETEQVSGRSTVRTAALDQELVNLQLAINSLITRSTAIQRDDNQLVDGIVHSWALAADALTLLGSGGFNPVGIWLTATAYAARDMVTRNTGTYVATVAHTSGVFATDLAAGKWILIFDSTTLTASAISFTPGGTLVSANVQAALAEAASEAAQKSAALSDMNVATARQNLFVPSWFNIQDQTYTTATLGGSADAITGDFLGSATKASLFNDFGIIATAFAANATTAPTYSQDGLTPKVIKKNNLQPLAAGDISGAGHIILLQWSAFYDSYFLLNPAVAGLSNRERVGLKLALSQLAR